MRHEVTHNPGSAHPASQHWSCTAPLSPQAPPFTYVHSRHLPARGRRRPHRAAPWRALAARTAAPAVRTSWRPPRAASVSAHTHPTRALSHPRHGVRQTPVSAKSTRRPSYTHRIHTQQHWYTHRQLRHSGGQTTHAWGVVGCRTRTRRRRRRRRSIGASSARRSSSSLSPSPWLLLLLLGAGEDPTSTALSHGSSDGGEPPHGGNRLNCFSDACRLCVTRATSPVQ